MFKASMPLARRFSQRAVRSSDRSPATGSCGCAVDHAFGQYSSSKAKRRRKVDSFHQGFIRWATYMRRKKRK